MGVKHLWSILEPACKQGSYDDLAGKTAAVDLSIWIIECRAVQSNHRNSLHLRTLFFRVLNMIYYNIKPIFILDSKKIIELKLDAVSKRLALSTKHTSLTRSNFNVLIDECSQLLTFLGLPIIRADGEAEKLCAQLNQMNIVDVVITNDSDCFVYGAKTIIRNFGIDMKSISFDIYDQTEIESNCRLTHRSFLLLALLLGSDYDIQGVQGIGREYALKFLQLIPSTSDPIDYLRDVFVRNQPKNKYEQKILNYQNLKHFEKIIQEYSSIQLGNLPVISSIAKIKWLKPVQLKSLQTFMKKKLAWIESYTFTKVFPLLTRFQILYRLNMLELDVQDVLSLSDMQIYQPVAIKKVRLRQGKQYYEIEWKHYDLPSTQTLDEQMNNLSLMIVNDDEDEDEKLITIEPADLFRHAYPDIVNAFETPILKIKKPKNITSSVKKKKTKSSAAVSTSMSLDLLSMMQDETCNVPISQKPKCKFNHRPTMAALSTSMNIDVLGVLERSNGNINALRKAKSRPIKHKARSDMIVHTQQPVTLLNTSISLDVLDIVLREKQPLSDDECMILDKENTNQDVLPLPLWDRIRQRTVV